jgi:hypothetical protein
MLPGRKPIGVFRNLVPAPQDPAAAIAVDLTDALTGQPGLRLAPQAGRRVFFGGGLEPQRFTRPQGGANTEDALANADRQINARRTLGKQRGRAPGR